MIKKPLSDIDETDIQDLKDRGVTEGKTLEYKRELPGTRDEDKREFLADVTSFANTDGGDMLYGIEENDGGITSIVGAVCADFDAETLRLDNLIRDGISPRLDSSIRTIPVATGKVLLVRIRRSWAKPHRVIFRGHDRFYARNSAGKFALDVAQLRNAFLESASLSERLTGFRLDRIVDISNDRGPVSLLNRPKLVLHVIPVGALSEQTQFDISALHRDPLSHRPWEVSSWNRQMTFDGVVFLSPTEIDGKVSTYAHFFRNGILEAVTTSLLETRQVPGQRLIPHVFLEQHVYDYLPRCFQTLTRLGVEAPVLVALTLIGVRGLQMAMARHSITGSSSPIREQNLMIPGVIVEDLAAPPGPILKPMFDRVWNACGLLESPNFDLDGKWKHHSGYY